MSGKICAVVNCHSSYRFLKLWTKTRCLEHVKQLHEDCPCLQPFSFRRFPKNPELRKEWLRVINRKDFLPTDNSVVCSKHFVDGSRIPQLEMGYEQKVVVGHHHFAKNSAPLHKKRKTHNHNTWNGNHLGENISLRTLDRLHTIMQLKNQEEKESLGRTAEPGVETLRSQLKARKREAKHRRRQQRRQRREARQASAAAATDRPEPSASEGAPSSATEDALDLDPSGSLLDDGASILDPLFDDSSRCSFYDSLDLDLDEGKTHPSMDAEMSEALEAGLRHVRADPTDYAAGELPWFGDVGLAELCGAWAETARSVPQLAEQPSTSSWLQNTDETRPEEPSPDVKATTTPPSPSAPHNNNNNDEHVKSHGREPERPRDPTRKTNARFVCDACDKSYALESALRRHRAANHAATRKCQRCGRESESDDACVCESSRLETRAVVRLDVKLLNCKICGERFQCTDSFRSHLLKHMADSDKSYVL